MCVNGILFIDIDCKIQLLKKFFICLDVGIYSLVVVCFKEGGFFDILNVDLGGIVLCWFDCVLKYYCRSMNKGKEVFDFLL